MDLLYHSLMALHDILKMLWETNHRQIELKLSRGAPKGRHVRHEPSSRCALGIEGPMVGANYQSYRLNGLQDSTWTLSEMSLADGQAKLLSL